MGLFRKSSNLPARIPTPVSQDQPFTGGTPEGSVKFFTILTDATNTPLAVGEIHPGPWEFINGQPGFVAKGILGAIRTGVATCGHTFVIGSNGSARLLTSNVSSLNIPPFYAGDDIIFDNSLTMPTMSLPSWL